MKTYPFYLAVLILVGCVTDESPKGGIPIIEYNEEYEISSTLLLGGESSFLLSPFPSIDRNLYSIGTLSDIRFDSVVISFSNGSSSSLSFIDSVQIELTDMSQTFIISRIAIDSSIVTPYKFKIGVSDSIFIRAYNLSVNVPRIRFKLKNDLLRLEITVKIIFSLGHITGYVA